MSPFEFRILYSGLQSPANGKSLFAHCSCGLQGDISLFHLHYEACTKTSVSITYASIQTVGAITEMVQGRLKPFFMQIGQFFESFKRWKKTNSSKNPDKTELLTELLLICSICFSFFWIFLGCYNAS